MALAAPVLCVSADVFMTCAKRRHPPKTKVSAIAKSSRCDLIFYVIVIEILTI